MIRTYKELIRIPTFEERLNYLRLQWSVGQDTFGFDRVFYQRFLKSREWLDARDQVISRDLGLDLGCRSHPIVDSVLVHHMNPITMDDIKHSSDYLLNPEYMISTSLATHNAIHYGTEILVPNTLIERKPGDTCPWKK